MNLQNSKVLVAGGAGFLGTNLIKRLLADGAQVRATLHETPAQIEAEQVDWVQADLTQKADCLKACEGMDALVITAAYTAGAMVIEKTPLALLTPNLILNTVLMEAAYESGIKKVVFISSNTVYPVSDQAMTEDDHTGEYFHKYHIVASMKHFSEQICEMYAKHVKNPMDVTVVRPGNMYGPYDDFEWESSHVLPAFIRRVIERHDPIAVWGNGEDIKDFIYVEDVARGVATVLEQCSGYNVYNIAGGQGYCLKDILNTLVDIDGYQDAKLEFDATKPTMIPIRLIDVTKAQQELGFTADTSMAEGLQKTLDWYRSTHGHH